MLNIYAFADEASPQITGQIAAMCRNGLQGLEIRGVDGENVSDISLEKAREVRARLADSGLTVWSVGSPIGKIPIDGDHAAHLDKLRHTLDIAEALGAGNIRMFSYYIPEGADPALYRGAVMNHLAEMARCAEGTGIRLCHENEKGIYGDIASRCLDVLTQVPSLYGVFDPANFIQCGQDVPQAWEMLKDRIFYLHIKDALQDGTVVPAGYGIGHVREIVQAYQAMGGTAVTIEPHLNQFSGLQGLGRAGEDRVVGAGMHFRDNDESFDAACTALKALL